MLPIQLLMRHFQKSLSLGIVVVILISSLSMPLASAVSDNKDACTIIEFKDHLYAGTLNFKNGCELFRSADGLNWEQVVGENASTKNGFGLWSNSGIWSAEVFNDELYIGTINFFRGCEVFKSSDGENFTKVIGYDVIQSNGLSGFLHHFNFYAWYMEVYNDTLFLGTFDWLFGGRLYSTKDGVCWDRVIGGKNNGNLSYGFGSRVNFGIRTLYQFNGYLFAGSATNPIRRYYGCEMWKSVDGSNWTKTSEDGFGDLQNKYAWSVAELNDCLYIGTFNWMRGCQVWETCDGKNWTKVVNRGFGDRNNWGIRKMVNYKGAIYATTENIKTGVEVWKTTDGRNWTQINEDGFGDSFNITARQLALFDGYIYTGLWNPFEGATILRFDGSEWVSVARL